MQKLQDMNQLGAVLRKTRKAQGLTQAQLAGVCGVGVRFIRELEQGKESCQIGKALLVVRFLGLTLWIEGEA